MIQSIPPILLKWELIIFCTNLILMRNLVLQIIYTFENHNTPIWFLMRQDQKPSHTTNPDYKLVDSWALGECHFCSIKCRSVVSLVSIWCWSGVGLVSACGVGLVLACAVGLLSVWVWSGVGLVSVLFWYSVGMVSVLCRCSAGMVSVWCWYGVGLVLAWCQSGVGLVSV